MRNRAKWTTAVIGLALLLGSAAVGVTQDKLALVTQRQDFMKAQGGDVEEDRRLGARGARIRRRRSPRWTTSCARRPKIVDQFPAGTSATDFPDKSKAKADLWSDQDKVASTSPTAAGRAVKLQGDDRGRRREGRREAKRGGPPARPDAAPAIRPIACPLT